MREGLRTIAFVLAESGLLIPDTMGGAIETLLTMLLEQNEKQGKYRFIFIYPDKKFHQTQYEHSICYGLQAKSPSGWLGQFLWKVWVKLGLYFPKLFPKTSKYYRRAYRYAVKEKADYIIAEGGQPERYVVFLRKWDREKIIIHLHHHFDKQQVYDKIFGKTLAISRFIAKEWNRNTPDKMEDTQILFNAIRIERFDIKVDAESRSKLRRALGIAEDDFLVLYCGRIAEVKGVKELVNAVSRMNEPKIKLLLIGSSDFARENADKYVEEVRALIQENGERIKYLGYIPNEKLYQYYKCADIQVVPSLWEEAAGLVTIEGMISKVPLIITRSGGMVEYVDEHYTGIIPKDGDVEKAIQDMIHYLFEHREMLEIMSEGAYAHARAYSAENYYARFCEVMEKWFPLYS